MKIATVGDNCMDVYESIGKSFPGGNPVNVAVYFVRLGGEASYIGAVGNDKYGKVIVEALNEKNVDTSHVVVLDGNTAITHVELVNCDRVFGEYNEGVLKQFKLSNNDIDFLCSHDLIVSGIWGMIENDLKKIKSRGIPIAFDFSYVMDDPVIDTAIGSVDYAFFASDKGDTPELRHFMQKTHARGPKVVTVTLGDKGSLAYDGQKFTVGNIVPCNVVDTMGAGDSFIAGFLYGIINKKSLKECMQMGATNSSVTLEYNGAW